MATNFKKALLDENEPIQAEEEATQAEATETVKKAPAAKTAEQPTQPETVSISPASDKIYYAIGLKDYSTSIAGIPVLVQAGKPWQGPKYHYDVLKRAKIIQ